MDISAAIIRAQATLNILVDSSSSSEDKELENLLRRIPQPRVIEFVESVVHKYSQENFKTNFRISRESAKHIIEMYSESYSKSIYKVEEYRQTLRRRFCCFLCYYADDTLNCEVFHYCQENQRHSWICPEGFTFHQIHLICMPPSNDNNCQQSSKYHIVNEYLYKPLNLQEHQSKPNVTLRYSERYYPENYYDNDRYEDDEEIPRPRVQHHRQPLQVGFQQQQQPQYQRPQQQIRHQPAQQQQISQPQQTTVYRKPQPVTTVQPHIQPQIQQIRNQAPTVTPSPYRFFTATPQLQHLQQNQQQVYRTPEEINISLQQRRPQIFIASTTPRYYEDEYLYERK